MIDVHRSQARAVVWNPESRMRARAPRVLAPIADGRQRGRLVAGLICATLIALLGSATPSPVSSQVPDPASFFGFPLGADGRLADWSSMVEWYDRLGDSSTRVSVDTVGVSTRGRPFIVVTITSSANQDRIGRIRDVQQRLADPRTLGSAAERAELVSEARAVVLLTHGIHSTEVGSTQAAVRIAHRLAASDDPTVRRILDEVVVVQIPSLNPDGTQWVTDWYARFSGTRWAGAPLPWLYHFYAGHDNNRDWYAFTQVETQLAVEHGHNAWRPHVVHDIHQMGDSGARLFLPPYMDPWEPNVDAELVASVNRLGMDVAAELTSQGRTGIVVNAIYDAWSPSRAYSHYHGGARILSETASARLADPIELPDGPTPGGQGYDATVSSWNHPAPWSGGRWGLPEIVDQMEATAMALLERVAVDRRSRVETSLRIAERAVAGRAEWPAAWVVPASRRNLENGTGLTYLLRALAIGDVEVRRTAVATTVDATPVPAGSWVVSMRQPYAGFAQALMQRQRYPYLRQYPGGPPVRPYDVTAHTLPLLTGVEVIATERLPGVQLGAPIPVPDIEFPDPDSIFAGEAPRIAIYKSREEPTEAGWTRWLFDSMELPYDTLTDADVRAGDLSNRIDVLLLQNQRPASITDGIEAGVLPATWTGGLGQAGARSIRDFVRRGGRLVAIEDATDFAIRLFDLNVGNAVERMPDREFFVPGSILRVDLEENPFSEGLPDRDVAWFWESSRAFDVTDPSARVLARYGAGDLVQSGWALGERTIAGRPALVEVPVGRGSVVLFGYQPNYRAQSVTGWMHLLRALDPARSALVRPGA